MKDDYSDNQIKFRELEVKELELRSNRLVSIIKTISTGIVITLVPAIINYQIQQQQVELKRLEGEIVYLDKFSDNVVEQEDLAKRKNFVEYLATIAHSEESRNRWNSYLTIVSELADKQETIEQVLSKVAKNAEASQLKVDQLREKIQNEEPKSQADDKALKKELLAAKIKAQSDEDKLVEKSEERERFIKNSSLASIVSTTQPLQVGLQTVGLEDDIRLEINKKLRAEGYALDSYTRSFESSKKPSWFSNNSTVLYYATKSKKSAEKLAALMENYTGTKFRTQRGAGLGVERDKRKVTFFVHYIKK